MTKENLERSALYKMLAQSRGTIKDADDLRKAVGSIRVYFHRHSLDVTNPVDFFAYAQRKGKKRGA